MATLWQSYKNTSDVAETSPPNYTVSIVRDRAGVETTTPINFGNSASVSGNASDILKVIVDIKAGYKIDKIEIVGIGTHTYLTSPVENLKQGVELSASGFNVVKVDYSESSEPVEPETEPVEPPNAKKVLFYNNDVSKLWDGVKNAIVKLSLWGEFNFATQEYPNKTYEIVLGEYNYLDWNTISDWESIESAYLDIKTIEPIKISKFRNDYTGIEDFETPRQEIEYQLTRQEITELATNGLTFLLQTKESETPPIEKDAISNQYYVTDDEFKTFKEEYLNILAGQTALEENPKVSDFLSSVKLLPFKIPEINKGDSQTPIKIQNATLNSKGTILVSDIISLNLGIISVPKMYNNSLDFKNVTIDLYLPFVNSSISIDPFYIIGNSVEIICNIVIETGDMTINLVNTLTNDIYNISNSTIGLDYPFFQTKSGDNLFSPKQAINSIRQAYVIVNTPDYSKSNPKSEIKGSLINEKGLINIKEVEININTTSLEKDMILTALNNGVIIK